MKELLKKLKEEIPYKWRVQSANKWGASCVAYIDSRQVQDILDDVIGISNWQVKFETNKGNLFASIGINIDGAWVWKSDCGSESKMEAEKGEASDAFKRAAVMWGIGRFLYSKDIIKLPVKEKSTNRFVPYSANKNKFITSAVDITNWCNAEMAKKQAPAVKKLIKELDLTEEK